MSAKFNHTIIAAKQPQISATFYRDLLEAEDAPSWGPFVNLLLADGVLLQFANPGVEFTPVHLAFLVDDDHFTRAYERICKLNIEHWADPQQKRPRQTNDEHGGEGVYLLDPAGHYLELLTRPYL